MVAPRIKAIIFDCFGVLTTEGWLAFKKQHFRGDLELMHQATDIRKQTDAGLLSNTDFLRAIADLAKVSEHEVRMSVDHSAADAELLDYIREQLKPHYRIGLLSNTGHDVVAELFAPADRALFDATALSYETGVTKPSLAAYRAIADKLGVEPEECVFVDDQSRYCAAARDTGMKAITYQDFDQFQAELEELLG